MNSKMMKPYVQSQIGQMEKMSAEKKSETGIYYFFLYVKNGVLKRVTQTTFSHVEGKVVLVGPYKVRVIGAVSWRPEGFFQGFSDFWDGMEMIINLVQKFGALRRDFKNVPKWLAHMTRIFLDIKRICVGNASFEDILSILTSLYLVKEEFKAESLDSFLLASASLLLPPTIMEIVKRMQVFSTSKVADDMSMFHAVIKCVCDLVETLFTYFKPPEAIKSLLLRFTGCFNILSHHTIVREMENVITVVAKKPEILANEGFRSDLAEISRKICDTPSISEWARKSGALSKLLTKFERVILLSKQYEHVIRQEPICVIFDGVSGNQKSVLMGKVVSVLNEPAYTHIVKADGDGKDFWDSYANQEIVCLDDLGQMGVSQWRTIINMVAGIVLPLDCARADLKDTKFFTSNLILVTTNEFKNLQLRADCGISNLEALHRRGYIINMKVSTRNVKTNERKGPITFEYYSLSDNQFHIGFPPEMMKYFKAWDPTLQATFVCGQNVDINSGQDPQLVNWLARIITIMRRVKSGFFKSNATRIDNFDAIKEGIDQLKAMPEPEAFRVMNGVLSRRCGEIFDSVSKTPVRRRVPIKWTSRLFHRSRMVSEEDFEEFYNSIGRNGHVCTMESPSLSRALYSFKRFIFRDEDDSTWNESPQYWQEYIINKMKDMVEDLYSVVLEIWSLLKERDIQISLVCVSVAMLGSGLIWHWTKKLLEVRDYDPENGQTPLLDITELRELPLSLQCLSKNVMYVKLTGSDREEECYGTVSGRNILLPSHVLDSNPKFVSIYKSYSLNHIVVDKECFTVSYRNDAQDVAVISLRNTYPAPFKAVGKFFQGQVGKVGDLLLNCDGCALLSDVTHVKATPLVYKNKDTERRIGEYCKYNKRGYGLCGTLFVCASGEVKGMHVAGNKATGEGVSVVWSQDVQQILFSALTKQSNFPFEESNKVFQNFSGIKLDANFSVNTPGLSNIVPSPLHGIYPVVREPANLTVYGRHTVKDVAKKSFIPVCDIDVHELEFAGKVIKSFIPEYSDVSMEQVIKGFDNIAGINKDSSNGFKCPGKKEEYIDFDGGFLLPHCDSVFQEWLRELDLIQKAMEVPRGAWDKLVWIESLKDEIRSISKQGVPRSFRVGTIYAQILTKMCCAQLISKLMQSRNHHQIMIGCNPYVDWQEISETLRNCVGIWAGDVAKWDGCMLPQLQRLVLDILLSAYKGQYKSQLEVLFEHTVHSIVAVNDDVFVTSHSMPSGSYLTAMLNSIMNKGYTAMWYYREMKKAGHKPSVSHFFSVVTDFVYGDDKLNGVSDKTYNLNAVTMRNFFQSIGMNFTDAEKQPIETEFQTFDEVSFLKRKFVFHPTLKRIVGVLDWSTLSTSMSWVDKTKDTREVMSGKIHAFQREIFLYPNYKELLMEFEKKCDDRDYRFSKLPEAYLNYLYQNPDGEFLYY